MTNPMTPWSEIAERLREYLDRLAMYIRDPEGQGMSDHKHAALIGHYSQTVRALAKAEEMAGKSDWEREPDERDLIQTRMKEKGLPPFDTPPAESELEPGGVIKVDGDPSKLKRDDICPSPDSEDGEHKWLVSPDPLVRGATCRHCGLVVSRKPEET